MRRIPMFVCVLLVVALSAATAATAGRSRGASGVRPAQVEVCPPSAKPDNSGTGNPGQGGSGNTGQGGASDQGASGQSGSQGATGAQDNPGSGSGQGTSGQGSGSGQGNAGGQGNGAGNSNAGGNGNGNGNAGGNGNGQGNGNAGGNGPGCVNPPADPARGAVAGDGTLPEAKAGTSVNVEPVEGVVNVKVPGTDNFKPLDTSAHLPEGTVLDTRSGTIELTTEGSGESQQTAAFTGAKFEVRQPKQAEVTDLVLRGGDFANCPRLDHGRRAQAVRNGFIAARGGNRRRLWGNGHGRFRTRGRWGSATVRGTIWQVEDRCDGTLTTVARGVVDVQDFGLGRSVSVRAGEQYFARVRP